MNNITMIPVGLLEHHPQNPRLDLGDLTELAESIRNQGVLQNLTVVPEAHFPGDDHYLVVIGNRRMEAAKMAGLAEVPCVISDMDYNTQIATMLTENIHRTDLTLFEQAQGIQMMMDLGLTETEISEMTGFSRTTIRRRAEMAKLDKETLKEKCTQLTIEEMDQLAKIRDVEKRNQIFKKYAGTGSFKWQVENAIYDEKKMETYLQVRGILLHAGCIEKSTEGISDFWNKYEFLPYGTCVNLLQYKPGDNILPKDERQLYFYMEYSSVRFWAEKRKAQAAENEEEPEELSEEEIAKRAEAEEVRKAWERINEIERHAKESRADFLEKLTIKQKDNRKALEWLIIALVATNDPAMAATRLLPDYDEEQLDALPKGQTEEDLDLKWVREEINANPQLYAELMDGLFFDGESSIMSKWRTSEMPEYCRNASMVTGYEWLEDFGYQVSDDERAYLDGTLDCYGEAER